MMLRRATQKDAQAIAAVHTASRRGAMPWLPVVHTPEEDQAFFRGTVLSNQSVFVAETAGQVIGFVAYESDWLNHLYVVPAFFRRGIGSALLSKAQTDANLLQLWVFQQNYDARAFYFRHGFTEVEFTDGASNEEKTPDVRMIWQADPSPR